MSDDDYGGSDARNKAKHKQKRRKLFPYRKGGKWRTEESQNKTI